MIYTTCPILHLNTFFLFQFLLIDVPIFFLLRLHKDQLNTVIISASKFHGEDIPVLLLIQNDGLQNKIK